MTETLLKGPHQRTFVDIGANFGYFSVLWLSKWGGDALAIEPIRQNFELLTDNVRSFGSRAKTVMCCLRDRPGEVTMSYDPQYPMLAKIGNHPGESQTVKMRRLTEVLETEGIGNFDVLKCDAEGYDVKILNNAREIFEKQRVQTLFFEPETVEKERDSELEDLTQFLLTNGYQAAPTSFDLCFYLPVSGGHRPNLRKRERSLSLRFDCLKHGVAKIRRERRPAVEGSWVSIIRSLVSRITLDAPTTCPAESLIGDTVMAQLSCLPPLVRRMDSK
jgi:FkbM family methyltransferase